MFKILKEVNRVFETFIWEISDSNPFKEHT